MACDAVIVAGFGFRAGAALADLQEALVLAQGTQVDVIATAADKAESAAFSALADRLGVPVVKVPARALQAQDVLTASRASLDARGTGSVAEAAAVYAAGKGARLLAPRVKTGSGQATCALAEGEGL